MDHRPAEEHTVAGSGSTGTSVAVEAAESRPEAVPAELTALHDAVERLRAEIAGVSLPFAVPGVEEARQERETVLHGLDGYALPRLRGMDAPLLVVVGGTTGAGKSTLTNSLIGVAASPAGVLRPTTRSPVLVHNPQDAGAFLSRRILPGLIRTSVSGVESLEPDGVRPAVGTSSLRLLPHEAVIPGMAIIDSPDLDSLVDANRKLARQLFGVADLWLFVTTGTDYADAVPWELLTEAVDRRLSVAVVLDRMRSSEMAAVRRHFATMLRDRGLASAPVITIPETTLVDGLLPPSVIAPLRGWLIQQVNDARTRAGHVSRAVEGMLEQSLLKVPALVAALEEHAAADRRLRADLDAAFLRARDEVVTRVGDGALLAEPVQAAWRRIAEAPEADVGTGRLRRAVSGVLRGAIARAETAVQTLVEAVDALVHRELGTALHRVADCWREDPATESLGDAPELTRIPDDLSRRVSDAVQQWYAGVHEGTRSRSGQPRDESGIDPAGAALTVLAVGADASWIGPVARAVIEGEGPLPDLPLRVHTAREDLRRRLADLVVSEYVRLRSMLDDTGLWDDRGPELRGAAGDVHDALTAYREIAEDD